MRVPDSTIPTEENLAQQFIITNNRIVRNGYTISFKNQVYQITGVRNIRLKAKVEIREHLDGIINIYFNKIKLEYIKVDQYVKYEPNQTVQPELDLKTKYKPDTNHPYRKNYKPEQKNKKTCDNRYLEFIARHYG